MFDFSRFWFSKTEKTPPPTIMATPGGKDELEDDPSDDDLDDLLDDMLLDNKKDKDILSYVFSEFSSENIVSKIFTKKYWKTAQIFGRLAHRTQLAYPLPDDLEIIHSERNNEIFNKYRALHERQYSISSNYESKTNHNDKNNNKNNNNSKDINIDASKTDLLYPTVHERILHENLKYAMRHAMAAYPPSFLLMNASVMSDRYKKQKVTFGSVAFKSQSKLLEKYFGKEHTNIIVNKLSDFKFNKTHQPCYYVMTDNNASINVEKDENINENNININKKRLIISIRGSISMSDFITDMDATNEKIHFVTRRKKKDADTSFFDRIINELHSITDWGSGFDDTNNDDGDNDNSNDKDKNSNNNNNNNNSKDNNDKNGKNEWDDKSGIVKRNGVNILQGHCHSGMYRSARWLKNDLEDVLFDFVDENGDPIEDNSGKNDKSKKKSKDKMKRKGKRKFKNKWLDYDIIITGHSLGAGVACMLALLYFSDPIIYKVFIKTGKLKCYGFAVPCIVDRTIGIDYPIGSGLRCARPRKSKSNENDEYEDKDNYNDKDDSDSDDRIRIDGYEHEYIYSIALGTDLVTRLSMESLLQCNVRLDYLRKCTKKLIRKSIIDLSDAFDFSNDKKEKEKEKTKEKNKEKEKEKKNKANDKNDENDGNSNKNKKDTDTASRFSSILDMTDSYQKSKKDVTIFLNNLCSIKARRESNLMYPAGRVLWYVPEIVFEQDIVKRRRKLMNVCYKDKKKYAKRLNQQEKEQFEKQQKAKGKESQMQSKKNKNEKMNEKMNENESKTAKDETGKESKIDDDSNGLTENEKTKWDQFVSHFKKNDREKFKKTSMNDMDWILTDATLNKPQFQNYIFEFWESLFAHFPQRYMAAIDPDLSLMPIVNDDASSDKTKTKAKNKK